MIRRKQELAPLTSLNIGGPAEYYAEINSPRDLAQAYELAERENLETFFLGEGTNVLFSDEGHSGLVLKNCLKGRSRSGREIWVAGGENLPELIWWLNSQGLAGMQRMYGIPGTIAGAIVGNAGAYGQEISQVLQKVTVWSQGQTIEMDASELHLSYRHSRLKEERDKFLLSCVLQLEPAHVDLIFESQTILQQREKKYPPTLCCPGSFFKNVVYSRLPVELQRKLPQEFVVHGKVPAGKLLEEVGANGSRLGEAEIAGYHGNLLVNRGRATASEVLALAKKYADLVHARFGIALEPEIRIANESAFPSGKV